MSKKTFAVRIAGNEYKIRSDSSDESLRQIAEFVDRAMQRVRDGTGTVDSLDVAVLTCLNLARELLAIKERRSGPGDAALRALIERIEEAIPGAANQAGSIDASPATASDAQAVGSDDDATLVDGSGGGSPEASASDSGSESSAKTLDLPSVEALRERGATSEFTSQGTSEDSIPEARMAAGGRDRAS
jgi:cell division protein ZapA (FtsZ GTPase activity inhibitor)